MSKIKISLANKTDALAFKTVSMDSFKDNFHKYGAKPPGIESVDWHKAQIEDGHYYKIEYDHVLVGGIDLMFVNDGHINIELFFIGPGYQDKKMVLGYSLQGAQEPLFL
jgi:hypothetical protein